MSFTNIKRCLVLVTVFIALVGALSSHADENPTITGLNLDQGELRLDVSHRATAVSVQRSTNLNDWVELLSPVLPQQRDGTTVMLSGVLGVGF